MRATGKYKTPPRENVSSLNSLVERLRVRIKGQACICNTGESVYYRPHDQEEEADEAFSGQLEIAPRSQALVLLEDVKHLSICWRQHSSAHTVLEVPADCLMCVVKEPTRRDVLLDILLINQEGLVKDMRVGYSLSYCDDERVEHQILNGQSKAVNRTRTLNFRRVEVWPLQRSP